MLSDAEARKNYDYNLDYEVRQREENRRREQARREAEQHRREQARQEAERRQQEQAWQEAERSRQEQARQEAERRQQEQARQEAERRRQEQERQEAERRQQEQVRQEAECQQDERWYKNFGKKGREYTNKKVENVEGTILCGVEKVVDFILRILFGLKVPWFFIFPIGVYISDYMNGIPDREVYLMITRITGSLVSYDANRYYIFNLIILCMYKFLTFHLLFLPFARLIRYITQKAEIEVPLWAKLVVLLFVLMFLYVSYDISFRVIKHTWVISPGVLVY